MSAQPDLFAKPAQLPAISNAEFAEWWLCYPHKVDKGHAAKAFAKARKIASLEELKSGVARYIRDKPPDRPWCNPATWLNGQRWLDEPAPMNGNGNGRHHESPAEERRRRAREASVAIVVARRQARDG